MQALESNRISTAPDREDSGRVLIIGAGLSGLAMAQALDECGIPARIIERSVHAGDAWRHRHPQLRLNTHRDLSRLPGMAFPPGTAAFPTRADISRYLQAYANALDVPIDYGVSVTRIAADGQDWTVTTDAGDYRSRHVVIATGLDRVPFIPDWPGRDCSGAKIIHAADLGDVARYRGKKVMVVGCGNSGSDVLNHLSGVDTARLWVSVRHGPAVFPKRFCGVPVQRLSPLFDRLPVRVVDALLALTQTLAFGDLGKWGLPRHPLGGATRLLEQGIAPAIDDGFVEALKNRRLEVVPEIRRLDASAVELVDGRRVDADVLIAATGYRAGLEGLLGNLDVLDSAGTPLVDGAQTLPGYTGLWFIGMRPRLPGFFHTASKASAAIAAQISASLRAADAAAGRAPITRNTGVATG